MKPAFSLFTTYDPVMINYIVAYIILIMTTYNCIFNYKNLRENVKLEHFSLIVGAMIGSFIGNHILVAFPGDVGVVQAILLSITILVVLLCVNREFKLVIPHTKINFFTVGIFSSVLSSFMGIGGGIFNVLIFNKLFKYSTKTSVALSLLVILFTQLSTVITLGMTTTYQISAQMIVVYGACAIIGAIFGSKINKKIDSHTVKKVYQITLTIFIFVNILLIFI